IKPNTKQRIKIYYELKIPNDKFTNYGFNNEGQIYLKDCFLSICRFENNHFLLQSNENLDDISNSNASYSLDIEIPNNYILISDLKEVALQNVNNLKKYILKENSRQSFSIVLLPESKNNYNNYKNDKAEVVSNLNDKRLNEIQIALIIDKITSFVSDELGYKSSKKVLVSKEDYAKNPFYGVNQLPSFINPFPDEFIFEIKFIKTYLAQLLKENIQINHRNDHWIEEGIQQFILTKYIEINYPKFNMLGSLSKIKLLKGYNIINTDFNDQFYYLHTLMTRKNLDQPLGDAKNTFVKFNEQIAGKYRAGLNLNYLDAYLENNIVKNSISEFMNLNQNSQTSKHDFKYILQKNSSKKIDWFFKTLVEKRDLIDFKFGSIKSSNDSLAVSIKNKTKANVPIPLYGIHNDSIVFKKWIENVKTDTTIVVSKDNIEKLVLNYKKEVPENNLRNNWYATKGFLFNHRPLKFNFLKDLENPYYNQVFYVPSFEFNLYDGMKFGIKFNNKSILDKPFTFNITPEYSTNTQKIVGAVSGLVNQNIRDGRLYNIKYSVSASTSHYAPQALYTRIIPRISFRFRDENFRNNKNEVIQLTQYYVNREKSNYTQENTTQNYSIFNARYFNIQSEVTKHFAFNTDLQVSGTFGKIATEIEYRKLFEDNRRITMRFYFGAFMYNDIRSDFFSFGIDRTTDYLFNYNLLGRSESTGLFSQQYVAADGGFKTKFQNSFANQWITSINSSFNIWNWIEIYGDVGAFKNKYAN
ncbi:MAG TPA: aminopeptidase, partial [Flavobacterium sp.]|nr:aminopeptidase [Flavobacterium sp.]